MRQLVDVGTKKAIKVDNLSDEFKFQLGEDLNQTSMLHIDTIYFAANGAYYYKAHEYKGNDKQYKGKKYARFKYDNIDVKEPSGVIKRTRKSSPMAEFEIIEEIEASYFVDEYTRLLKEGFTSSKQIIEMTKEASLEDYITQLISKQLKNK